MDAMTKKGIGQYLDKDYSNSKKIIDRMNYFYSLMTDEERIWIKKQFKGIKTSNHKMIFNQNRGFYSEYDKLISICEENHGINRIIEVFFHELGHYIDFSLGKISMKAINVFIKELEKKQIINIEQYILSFDRNVRYSSSLMFDSLCILYSLNPWEIGCIGHDKKYFTCNRIYGAAVEMFAEFFAEKFMHNNEPLKMFKREFPKTFYYLNTKINNLLK